MRFFFALIMVLTSAAAADEKCTVHFQGHIISADTAGFWSTLDHLEQLSVIGRIEKFLSKNPIDTSEGRKAFREMIANLLTGSILADDERPWISGFLKELSRDPNTLKDVSERLMDIAKHFSPPPTP